MTTSPRIRVCFVGGAGYSAPLEPTQEKKFRLLAERFDVVVVGCARTWRPIRFHEHATFYLLPRLWPAPLRQAVLLGLGSLVAVWVVLRHRTDVIVAQSPYEGAAGAVAKGVARLLRRAVRLVIEAHSDFELDPFQQRRVRFRRLYQWAMSLTAQFSFMHADALRSISSSTDAQLRRWAPGRPVERFPTWTDMGVFLEAGVRRNVRGDFLFVGTLIPRKGLHHLVRGFERVAAGRREARLTILGEEVNPPYAEELRQLVHELGLDEQVRFEPALPQDQLAMRMAQAAVLVLPSLSEGLGRVVFEAMATGTPVVASEVGGIPDMVREGETGWLIPPGDESALAERLEWVLAHPAEVAEAGQRARAFAKQFFSPDQYLAHYESLFAQAMERHAEDLGDSGVLPDGAKSKLSYFG